jgi:23S rRNA-/tRNA-specific pseudouridylate synthase
MDKWVVTPEESGLKLLKFLKSKYEAYSSKQLKSFLENNLCAINGITERFATAQVYKGDNISFKIPTFVESKKDKMTFSKDRILYEDDELLIYNKPAGLTSDSFKTDLKLIHRLDRETTGVLMFAKSDRLLEEMIKLFRQHLVRKVYLAIVDGTPKQQKGIVDNYLGKKHVYEGQAIWGKVSEEKGLHAVTEWTLEKAGKNFSLLRCYPKTGRTHQIRVHLSEMKLPILGDYQYCRSFKCTYQPDRCLLHAYKVLFIHPTKKIKMEVKAPLPSDFLLALKEKT